MLFINTRPIERADALSHHLRLAGYDVDTLPLLELIDNPLSPSLQQLYEQLHQAQVLVVVSPKAVELGFRYLSDLGMELSSIEHIQWVAVGVKTAEALRKYGISSHIPQIETSEGMLQLPVLERLPSAQTVAFWRGQGGRQFMMESLQAKGVNILNFVLYHRVCPTLSAQKIQSMCSKILSSEKPTFLLITSEASWKNWLHLIKDRVEIHQKLCYVVLGERLQSMIQQFQIQNHLSFSSVEVSSLIPEVILRAMTQVQGI